jgi:hypothetical protein
MTPQEKSFVAFCEKVSSAIVDMADQCQDAGFPRELFFAPLLGATAALAKDLNIEEANLHEALSSAMADVRGEGGAA